MALVVEIATDHRAHVAVRCPRCTRALVMGEPRGSFQVICKLCSARVDVVSDLNPRPQSMASLESKERGPCHRP
jgi:hypothetical protein